VRAHGASGRCRAAWRALLGALLGLCPLLTGCSTGGTNGVAHLSAADAVSRARAVAIAAPSVHIKGTLLDGGDPVTIDMRLRGADGGTGQVSADGDTFQLLRIGQEVYLRGDASFYSTVAGERSGLAPQVTAALQGKYLHVPPADGGYAKFAGFTSVEGLFGDLVKMSGKLRKDGQVTVRGMRSLSIVTGDGHGAQLAIAMDGTPYPTLYRPAGAAGGSLEFFDYGAQVDLTPPPAAQVVDIDKLAKAATASPGPSPSPSRSKT
jgi:hypothetical protein